MNNPAGVHFFMAVNLSRELNSFCNCNLSSSEAVSILLLMESFISCNALSTSLLKNLAIKVTLSLLVLGSKSKSTLACSSIEEILWVSNDEDDASSRVCTTSESSESSSSSFDRLNFPVSTHSLLNTILEGIEPAFKNMSIISNPV